MNNELDYNSILAELQDKLRKFYEARKELKSYIKYYDQLKKELEDDRQKLSETEKTIIQLAKERQIGFPALAKAYEEFFELQDREIIKFLKYKAHPAVESSKLISEYARQRRVAERERKILQYLVDYYETVAPFLLDLKEEVQDITEEDKKMLEEYTPEEREDPTTDYLTKEEFRKLPSSERNQLALDRYWKRPKSKWHVGKMYERYVGYIFESQGYEVEYVGIFKGLEDLGRDIIAYKDDEIIIAQCKNWAKFKTIFEKHIFQFFGTVFQYRDENRTKRVRAVFYTTTGLSPLAQRFAKELGIELKENFKMDKSYPCIKCNISQVDGSKIYHLPFDQQYDKTKIKNKGEFYCATAAEAEAAGFRRAYRFSGLGRRDKVA